MFGLKWTVKGGKDLSETVSYWLARNISSVYPVRLISEASEMAEYLREHAEAGRPTNIPNVSVSLFPNISTSFIASIKAI